MHPVNVEAVAWIFQQKTNLSMLFHSLSIHCHLRHMSLARGGLWYGFSPAAFTLSLLAKTSTVGLPLSAPGLHLVESGKSHSDRFPKESPVPFPPTSFSTVTGRQSLTAGVRRPHPLGMYP